MTHAELIDALCETIEKQAETISQLVKELEQFRALSEEEAKAASDPAPIDGEENDESQ